MLSCTSPKRGCTHTYAWGEYASLGATGAETSLLLSACTALNNPDPIHAADGYYARDSSCITFLWLHKVCVSYHKNGLVSIVTNLLADN